MAHAMVRGAESCLNPGTRITRWTTDLSSKVNTPRRNVEALCGANLVTLTPKLGGQETLEVHRVGRRIDGRFRKEEEQVWHLAIQFEDIRARDVTSQYKLNKTQFRSDVAFGVESSPSGQHLAIEFEDTEHLPREVHHRLAPVRPLVSTPNSSQFKNNYFTEM